MWKQSGNNRADLLVHWINKSARFLAFQEPGEETTPSVNTAAYQEGIITTKECLFILGSTTTPLTESRRRKLLSNHQEDRWLRITLVALDYILGRSALV